MHALHTETIEHDGHKFRVEHFADEDTGAPWKQHEGYGVISEWTTRDKKPGEVIIATDRSSHRFYDVSATLKIAKRDGWGLSEDEIAKLAKTLGRAPTKGEITRKAVDMDAERMRGWCNDDWCWIGVVVTLLTVDGDALESRQESLWGIESDSSNYLREVAQELAEQIDTSSVGV